MIKNNNHNNENNDTENNTNHNNNNNNNPNTTTTDTVDRATGFLQEANVLLLLLRMVRELLALAVTVIQLTRAILTPPVQFVLLTILAFAIRWRFWDDAVPRA